MLRLSILLIVAMAFAWSTLGEDTGQLRPGLAKAAAEGRLEEVWAEARAREAAKDNAAEGAFVLAEAPPEPKPEPAALPEPVVAATEPVTPDLVVEPEREVVQAVTDPVFSLESFGNESVPGAEESQAEALAAASGTTALPEPAEVPETEADIWYVQADSVNIRAEPSTEAEILGKLGTGEQLVLVELVNDEWARIALQGDGGEGYVAIRLLSPLAP
jgi:hypothetical protein